MMTIICGTNRPNSNSARVVKIYAEQARKQGVEAQVYNLEDLPSDFFNADAYGTPPPSFSQVLNNLIQPVSHFVFVVPEYNGSFPGILKLFLDTIHPKTWDGKKAALIGLASGRAGNLRGLDHLLGVLHYLKVEVYSQKPLLSSIHQYLTEGGELNNEEYLGLINSQIESFKKF